MKHLDSFSSNAKGIMTWSRREAEEAKPKQEKKKIISKRREWENGTNNNGTNDNSGSNNSPQLSIELKWLLMQMDSLENCGMWMAVKVQVTIALHFWIKQIQSFHQNYIFENWNNPKSYISILGSSNLKIKDHETQISNKCYKTSPMILRLFVLLPSISNRREPCIFLWYDAYQNCLQGSLMVAIGDFHHSWLKQDKAHEVGQTMSILQAPFDLDLSKYVEQCQEEQLPCQFEATKQPGKVNSHKSLLS